MLARMGTSATFFVFGERFCVFSESALHVMRSDRNASGARSGPVLCDPVVASIKLLGMAVRPDFAS